MVRYALEQRVFLYDTYEKYGSAGKRRRKFRDERVPSRQTTNNLVNKLRTTGPLTYKKTKHTRRVLTEKLDDIGASRNPRTEEELRENISREISNIAAENLQTVNQNLFRLCEECLRVEGQHFQHLL
jgi:DNA-binding SARP family transcriptional activator